MVTPLLSTVNCFFVTILFYIYLVLMPEDIDIEHDKITVFRHIFGVLVANGYQ